MGVEIEHKFLVTGTPWDGLEGRAMVQGYLASQDRVVVRVRIAGERAWITVKGPSQGAARPEFEYAVPVADAEGMLALCADRVVRKTRYRIPVGEHVWDVDVFEGRNAPLVLAEVELGAEGEAFERPGWLGEEVTLDARYANACLADRPFGEWGVGAGAGAE